MKRRIISFELRQNKDDDIAEMLQEVSKTEEQSHIIREALRSYFFQRTNPLQTKINFTCELRPKSLTNTELAEGFDTLLDNY